jgi:hypothetical protein
MPDAPIEALEAWPWPRWEFIDAMRDDDGVTVALAPMTGERDHESETEDGAE